MTTTTTRCLLLGSSGFLGRHIRSSLERRGLSCTGAQRSASAQDVAYGFPNDDLAQTLAGQTFDCVIVAARFAGAKEVSELTLEAFEEKMGTLCRSFQLLNNQDRGPLVVYVSSDAVFSGSSGPYGEADPPQPTTEYGQRQLAAERVVSSACPNHLIVRCSYLYSYLAPATDKRLSKLKQSAEAGQAIRADKTVIKSPVSVETAAASITDAALGGAKGILHIAAPQKSVFAFFAEGLNHLGLGDKLPLLTPSETPPHINTSLISHVQRPEH